MTHSETSVTQPVRIGLIGFGRAGRAVARVLLDDPTVRVGWVLRQSADLTGVNVTTALGSTAAGHGTIHSIVSTDPATLLREAPVDAIIDFSSASALSWYAPIAVEHGIAVVSAISHYGPAEQHLLSRLGRRGRLLWSPNISLGVNCLMLVATALRAALPHADIAVVEEHFRDKVGVSGTALRLASRLALDEHEVTSLRLGGTVGVHRVVFGLPDQIIRLSHESTSREAFGTGALFAVHQLLQRPCGLYTMEELLRSVLWPDLPAPVRASA